MPPLPRSSQNSADEGPDPADVIKILVATDNHLGYGEKYANREYDSFTTFDEILQIGNDHEVDFVLLGGDLFHENRPSRQAEHHCMRILKKHVFSDRPVSIELVSNPKENFKHCDEERRDVNYMDENLNIGLPVFSIHGNHDDPSGLGGFCSLDNLHTAGLINYFGRVDNLKEITVSPLLFKKGSSKLALYGMSSVKDERLYRLFREKCVNMVKDGENSAEWFNLLVLHQNRNAHSASSTNHIPPYFIDDMFDLVVWGHEHECRLIPEHVTVGDEKEIFISQPGSSVATSLCEAESVEKFVGILEIYGKRMKMTPVKLKTVRPMLFRTITLDEEMADLGLSRLTDEKKIQEMVDKFLKNYVERLLDRELPKKLTGHPEQPTLPLVRVRVEYTDEKHQLSVGRFGNHFHEKIANPSEILLFKKLAKNQTKADGTDFASDVMEELMANTNLSMEDLISEYFGTHETAGKLKLLSSRGMHNAVSSFINNGNKDALPQIVNKQLNKVVSMIVDADNFETAEDIDAELERIREERYQRSMADVPVVNDEDVVDENAEPQNVNEPSDDGDDAFEAAPPTRGRGSRGARRAARAPRAPRGSRGRGTTRSPGRSNDSLADANSSISGRGQRGSSRKKPVVAPVNTIGSAFARQRRSTQSSARSGVVYDDTDSD